MIKEFNPVEVNKRGKIYVETFEQIKLIHEKDQENWRLRQLKKL